MKPFILLTSIVSSVLIQGVYWLCIVLQVLSPSIRRQMRHRSTVRMYLTYRQTRRDPRRVVFFFCSSAGEYEQALPIRQRLPEHLYQAVFVLFSQSAETYIQKRQEPFAVKRFLALPDTLWHWAFAFLCFRPKVTFVVGYEFWPAFLSIGAVFSKLILVNARAETNLHRRVFHRAFDARFDQSQGDTKWDRVVDRKLLASSEPTVELGINRTSEQKVFVLGSAWRAEMSLVIDLLATLNESSWDFLVIFAPHHPSPSTIAWLEEKISQSQINRKNLIIESRVGRLGEIYAMADAALIGGALQAHEYKDRKDFKVHNVLEPAVYGLDIAFGPHFQNSIEALELVAKGLATVVSDFSSLKSWFFKNLEPNPRQSERKKDLMNFVAEKTGAADRIIRHLCENGFL